MGAVSTIVATIAATLGAVALYRAVERRVDSVRKAFSDETARRDSVIDYERDPETGVFHPKG